MFLFNQSYYIILVCTILFVHKRLWSYHYSIILCHVSLYNIICAQEVVVVSLLLLYYYYGCNVCLLTRVITKCAEF